MNAGIRARVAGVAVPVVLLGAVFARGGAHPTAETAWAVAIAALVVLLCALDDPRDRRRAPAPFVPIAAAAGSALAVSVLFAPYRWGAAISAATWIVAAAWAWVAGRLDEARRIRVLELLLAGAGILGAAACIERIATGARPDVTFRNPNHLAAWLAVVAIATWPRIRTHGGWRWVPWLAAAAGWIATGSRGGILAGVAGAATLAVVGRREDARPRRLHAAASIAVAAAIAAAVFAWRAHEADPFRWQRVRIWQAVFTASVERPWVGLGPGQFAIEADRFLFPDADGPLRYDRRFGNTHSDLLRVPAELGWPFAVGAGLVALLGFVTVAAAARRRPEAAGRVAALVAWAVAAAVDNPTQRPALVWLAAFLVGGFLYRSRASGGRAGESARTGRVAIVVVAACGLAAFELWSWSAWRASTSAGVPPSTSTVAPAWSSAPGSAGFPRRTLAEAGRDTTWDLDRYARYRTEARRWTRLQPNSPDPWRALGRVERVACVAGFRDRATCERALVAFARARARDPFDVSLALETAALATAVGDGATARRAADRAVRLEPEAAAVWFARAQTRLAADPPDLAGARSDLERARRLDARHRDAWLSHESNRPLVALDPEVVADARRRLEALANAREDRP